MKKIHPRNFFELVKLKDYISPTLMDVQKQRKLFDIHPSCIISNTNINLPIFEVKYDYINKRGKKKNGVMYLVTQEAHEDSWVEVEVRFLDEIQKHNRKYRYKVRENAKILSTEIYGYASFDIGI